jgi:hypothetical protein
MWDYMRAHDRNQILLGTIELVSVSGVERKSLGSKHLLSMDPYWLASELGIQLREQGVPGCGC